MMFSHMTSRMSIRLLVSSALCPLLMVWVGHCSAPGAYQRALANYKPRPLSHEVRALWIVRDQITTRARIREIVAAMERYNFNTAVVQVRGRGDAFYRSSLAPLAEGVEPGLDPLREFLRLARPRGIQVHAWINSFLALDEETRRWAPRSHLMYTRPHWFIRDREGRSLLDYTPREWKAANVEGAFLDPAVPEVRRLNVAIAEELVRRYEVDGIHLDYIRYPWSRANTVYDFGRDRAVAGTGASVEDTAAVNRLRRANITKMVAETRLALDRLAPGLILSAAVWPSDVKIREHIFQDFPGWLRAGLLDYAFLMAYYGTIRLHDDRLSRFHEPAINHRLVIGMGVFRDPRPEVTAHQLKSARAIGAAGVCYFRANWFYGKGARERVARHRIPEAFARRLRPDFRPSMIRAP